MNGFQAALLPYLICIATETSAQLCFSASGRMPHRRWFFLFLGSLIYVPQIACWLWVLSLLPLGVALPLMGANYVTVAVAGRLVFGDPLTRQRVSGIGLILIGLLVIFIDGGLR